MPAPYRCGSAGLLCRIFNPDVEKNPPPPPPLFWLPAHFTRAERRDDEALEILAYLHYMEAVWREEQGDRPGAIKALETSVQTAPRIGTVVMNAAVLFDEWGEEARSEKYLKETESLQPSNYSVLLNLGIHYGKTAQWDLCRKYLDKAALLKPEDPVLRRYRTMLDAQH
jgi:tetratricopeptide (TPR) repeat protein